MSWDPVTTFNLVLSAAICAVGIVGWARVKNALALYIGLAFGLFALSHLATILGKAEALEALLILLHGVGYILIAIAIYKVAFPRKPEN
ncbi:MAG: hypothetical protein NTY63_07940 [Candidatus Bipolaricaulota bacterium]|nr:hypothetical protein [Candidatus Bipolaricaulota bacterium]